MKPDAAAVAIIGSGPAGLSCALWLKQLGFKPTLIEQATTSGGSLSAMNRPNRWVLGFPGQTSQAIAERYRDHIGREQIPILTATRLTGCEARTDGFRLKLDHQGQTTRLAAGFLVIATGIRPRGLESFDRIPGSEKLANHARVGFHPLSHLKPKPRYADASAVVIGGGDNAFYTALDLLDFGARVDLLIRGDRKARPGVQRAAQPWIDRGRLSLWQPASIEAIGEQQGRLRLQLANGPELQADWLFPRLGYTPNTEFLRRLDLSPALDRQGYIKTDHRQRTDLPNVHAIGDVASPWHQSVVGALAQGAIAAQAISEEP